MKQKRRIIAAAVALALVTLLLVAGTSLAKRPVITQEDVVWDLTKIAVSDPGQVITMDEGLLTSGYTLVAKARSKGGNLVPEGQFVLKLDAFSPTKDMPGQKAGRWYIRGEWTITRTNALPESAKARHSPDVAKGTISAELTFNPTEAQQGWSALASLPMSTAAGRWGRGKGTFVLSGQGDGGLTLSLAMWPEMQ